MYLPLKWLYKWVSEKCQGMRYFFITVPASDMESNTLALPNCRKININSLKNFRHCSQLLSISPCFPNVSTGEKYIYLEDTVDSALLTPWISTNIDVKYGLFADVELGIEFWMNSTGNLQKWYLKVYWHVAIGRKNISILSFQILICLEKYVEILEKLNKFSRILNLLFFTEDKLIFSTSPKTRSSK